MMLLSGSIQVILRRLESYFFRKTDHDMSSQAQTNLPTTFQLTQIIKTQLQIKTQMSLDGKTVGSREVVRCSRQTVRQDGWFRSLSASRRFSHPMAGRFLLDPISAQPLRVPEISPSIHSHSCNTHQHHFNCILFAQVANGVVLMPNILHTIC